MTDDHTKIETDEVTGVDTTGHEWDGIKELNNPLPRWWLIIFYASIVWSIGYWVLMPSWPGINDYLHGTRNHSERVNVANQLEALKSQRQAAAIRLLSVNSLEEIENDPELLQFAMASGKTFFADNCATCHGSGGQGFIGYPNLNDDVWLWGGSLDEIKQTITYGIRSSHPQTHRSLMPAYGVQGILTPEQINDLVDYVSSLSGLAHDEEAATRAAPTYQAQCTSCHGLDGKGDRLQGAPDLTDKEWLYGSDRAAIRSTITNARNSVMPNWNERFDEPTITALAIYVHTLGGGE